MYYPLPFFPQMQGKYKYTVKEHDIAEAQTMGRDIKVHIPLSGGILGVFANIVNVDFSSGFIQVHKPSQWRLPDIRKQF